MNQKIQYFQQKIIENPNDVATWLVYGDYLQSLGIIQGELIALHFAYEEANKSKKTKITHHINALVQKHWKNFTPNYWPSLQDNFIDNSGVGPEMMVIPPTKERKAFCIGKYVVSEKEYTLLDILTLQKETSFPMTYERTALLLYSEELSKKTRYYYRAPLRDEWVYAASAGTNTNYWWGDNISLQQANYDARTFFSKTEYYGKVMPVDSFYPNPWGLYQVHGNVWEWVFLKDMTDLPHILCGGAYNQKLDQLKINNYVNLAELHQNINWISSAREKLKKFYDVEKIQPFANKAPIPKTIGLRVVREFKHFEFKSNPNPKKYYPFLHI